MRPCGTGGTALVHCVPRRSGNAVFIIDSIRCGAGILMRCVSGSTGRPMSLWRAVDHEGEVVEVFVTKRRDRRAALEFLTRAMTRYGRPASIVTDRRPSYRAAMQVIGNEGGQETGRWLNNRAENSHHPFRRREGAMARFRDIKNPADIHLRPCLDPQPFQPPTPSQSPRHFQTRPSRRPGRVASTCSLIVLDCRFFGSSLISLTMPARVLWCGRCARGEGRGAADQDRVVVSTGRPIRCPRSDDQEGEGARTATVEEGVWLPSARARGECVLPVHVDRRRLSSGTQFIGGNGVRPCSRVTF